MVSAKTKVTSDKIASYACGENFLAKKIQVNIQNFFLYIIFFMIFDITALVLAMSFGVPGFYPLLFITIILFTIFSLLPLWVRNK